MALFYSTDIENPPHLRCCFAEREATPGPSLAGRGFSGATSEAHPDPLELQCVRGVESGAPNRTHHTGVAAILGMEWSRCKDRPDESHVLPAAFWGSQLLPMNSVNREPESKGSVNLNNASFQAQILDWCVCTSSKRGRKETDDVLCDHFKMR